MAAHTLKSRALGGAAMLLFLAAVALAGAAPARADNEVRVTVASIDESQFPTVRVTFSVERDGRPQPQPATGDIRLNIHGREVAAKSLITRTDTSVPLAVVLAIDVSGSMAGDTLVQARNAAAELIGALGPADRAAIVTFGSTVRVVQGMTQSKQALQAALQELRAGGDTALYDGIVRSAELARDSGVQRRSVIVLSDGEDFGGRSLSTREQAAASAAQGGVVFYAAGVGDAFDRSLLAEIAASTGGRFFEAGGAADIPPLYSLISTLLRGQYTVEFDVPADLAASEVASAMTVRYGAANGSTPLALSARPAAATPTVAATPTAAATEPPATVEPAEESSGSNAWLFAIIPVALIAAGGGAFLFRRRRTVSPAPPMAPAPGRLDLPAAEVEEAGQWSALFTVAQAAGEVAEFRGGPGPITIGSDPECEVRLPRAEGVSSLHARVWYRDGRTMLHHLQGNTRTEVNGHPVEWTSISDGDAIAVGPYTITYKETLLEPAPTA